MASKLVPFGDKIVLRPIVQEEVLSSGIVIPDTAREKPNQGEVVSVGPGRKDEAGKLIPMEIAAGDRVLYAKYTGQEIKVENDEYIVLKETDILCKVEV